MYHLQDVNAVELVNNAHVTREHRTALDKATDLWYNARQQISCEAASNFSMDAGLAEALNRIRGMPCHSHSGKINAYAGFKRAAAERCAALTRHMDRRAVGSIARGERRPMKDRVKSLLLILLAALLLTSALPAAAEGDVSKEPTVLLILDGYGVTDETEHNAIALADTPVMDRRMRECPFDGRGQRPGRGPSGRGDGQLRGGPLEYRRRSDRVPGSDADHEGHRGRRFPGPDASGGWWRPSKRRTARCSSAPITAMPR